LPELPDVEVFRRYLQSTSLKRRVRDVRTTREELYGDLGRDDVVKALKGSRLEDTRRHGKNLFVKLSGGKWLLLHFGMSGFLKSYRKPSEEPPHQRLVMELDDGSNLAYDSQRLLGTVSVVESPEEYARRKGLGPDALSDRMSAETLAELLEGSRATMKSALMDQGRIAGLGNVYTDEALFQAGIHPRRRAGELSKKGVKRLYRTMTRVLRKAIDFGADASNAPRSWLLPRREDGAECPRCGGSIERTKISGRTTYFCPRCQPS
jgi:formamidopyrimidine-DNA glycosylase